MHLSGFQKEKIHTKKPTAPSPESSGMLIIKAYWFFSVRASLSGGTTRSESKERRGEVPLEKTSIFFSGGEGGLGWEEGSQKTAAAAECKLLSIPVLDGKAPDEMTVLHVLYSCGITFSAALCFTYWQEHKALWLCENPEDLGTEQVCKPENTDKGFLLFLQYSDHEHKIKSAFSYLFWEEQALTFHANVVNISE